MQQPWVWRNAERRLHPVSQPSLGCIALLSMPVSSLWDRDCLENSPFCTDSSAGQQLLSGDESRTLSHPALEQKAAFTHCYSLSVSKGQLAMRTQESHNQPAYRDAQCRGGGIYSVVKEMAVLQDPDVQCCATCQVP